MDFLLPDDELPHGFSYPPSILRVVESGLTNLPPWWILHDDRLRTRLLGLSARYPHRRLVPFAFRQDSDDVAAFDLDRDSVIVVHDFASAGFEQRAEYPDFERWFRQAVDDFLDFE